MRATHVSAAAFAVLFAAGGACAAGGVYASAPATDAAACARMCADDGLCIAWTFRADGACELRATVPATPTDAPQGFSQRAPPALRGTAVTPETDAAASRPAPGVDQAPPAVQPEDSLSAQLLGGLEEDASGLRY